MQLLLEVSPILSSLQNSKLMKSSTNAITSGNFADLKLTAEKLASLRTGLDLANSKLMKSSEDRKLWLGLESKLASTKMFCDQQLLDNVTTTRNLSQMAVSLENLEREKIGLQFSNDEFARKLGSFAQETQTLKKVVHDLASKTRVSDKNSKTEKVELLLKLSVVWEKKQGTEKLQADIQKKEEEAEGFQKDILRLNQQVKTLENQMKKLNTVTEEKEQPLLQSNEKQWSDQKAELLAQWIPSKSKLLLVMEESNIQIFHSYHTDTQRY